MKIPDSWNRESSHKVNPMNTMSLIGISFLWAHFLGLISLYWLPVTILALMAAYGSELKKRDL
jgi:hypothetical protein